MKKVFALLIVLIVVGTSIPVAAYTQISGQVWIGKPGWLGVGYYCTAAQNTSPEADDSFFAYAKTIFSGNYTESRAIRKNRAVASSGDTKPSCGFGYYGYGSYQSNSVYFTQSDWD